MSTEPSNPERRGRRRPVLLLVDDTASNIDVLVGLLKADHDLKVANRGERALAILEANPDIDLVLLDVMMPEMNGFAVCHQLRRRPATRETPVLFLTAKGELEDIVEGFLAGGTDYLTKPFRPEELLARVRTHLLVVAQRREIERRNTELKELLHVMCHDLANHFAVLSLSLNLLEGQEEEILRPARAAVKNGIDLTQLVREIRRSEDKNLKRVPVDLRAAVDESLLLLDGKFRSKGIEVRDSVPRLSVLAEPCALINSVLNNVLSNAIKFSHPGDAVELEAAESGGEVLLVVRDHGIGMSPGILEHLFDMGRSHSRVGTAGEEGTGFGMPLMGRLVRQFGGRVEVNSRDASSSPDDHGTEFRITLQRA